MTNVSSSFVLRFSSQAAPISDALYENGKHVAMPAILAFQKPCVVFLCVAPCNAELFLRPQKALQPAMLRLK